MTITAFAVTPVAGAALNSKGSTRAFAPGTTVLGSDGFRYTYLKTSISAFASTAILAVTSLLVPSTAASAAVANHKCLTQGGVAIGQHFWARQKNVSALS